MARKAFSLQDPPRNNGRHSHGLHHQLHTVLSLATALKPVSSPSLAPGPPCLQSLLSSPSRTRPQAGLSTPRADLACLRLPTRPWLRSTVGRRQAPQPGRPGPSDMSPASSPASLSICLPADLTFQLADPPSASKSLTLPSMGRLHLLFTHISEPLFSVRIQLLPQSTIQTCYLHIHSP